MLSHIFQSSLFVPPARDAYQRPRSAHFCHPLDLICIPVCSLHSRKKIKEKYPFLTKLALDEFYGRSANMKARWTHIHEEEFDFKQIPLSSKLNWTKLDSIDLREFVASTTPEYFIETCNIELFDCRIFWRQVQTFHGSCIAVSPPCFQANKNLNIFQLNVTDALHRHHFLQNGSNQSREDFKDSFIQLLNRNDFLERKLNFRTLQYWSDVRLTLAFNRSDVTTVL